MSSEKKALYALLGAPRGDKRTTAYVIEVSFGGTRWRHVTAEPLIWDEDAALARVQSLNGGVGDAASALSEITGKPLRTLAHSYRAKPVTLSYPKAEKVMSEDERYDRQITKTKKHIKRALLSEAIRVHEIRFMVDPLGLIIVSFLLADRLKRDVAENALAALRPVGYTGSVQQIDSGVAEHPIFEVRLVGPFPLIPNS